VYYTFISKIFLALYFIKTSAQTASRAVYRVEVRYIPLDVMIRAAMEELARRLGFPEKLKDIPIHEWIKSMEYEGYPPQPLKFIP